MKTNVSVDLNDHQRDEIANILDGRVTKRLATRAEIVQIVQQHIGGFAAMAEQVSTGEPELAADGVPRAHRDADLYVVDPRDRPLMSQPDNPSYVRGWNQVKRRERSRS